MVPASCWLKCIQRELQTRISDARDTIAHLRQEVQEQRKGLEAEERETAELAEVVRAQDATTAGARYLSPISEGTKIVDLPINIGLIERPVS